MRYLSRLRQPENRATRVGSYRSARLAVFRGFCLHVGGIAVALSHGFTPAASESNFAGLDHEIDDVAALFLVVAILIEFVRLRRLCFDRAVVSDSDAIAAIRSRSLYRVRRAPNRP